MLKALEYVKVKLDHYVITQQPLFIFYTIKKPTKLEQNETFRSFQDTFVLYAVI